MYVNNPNVENLKSAQETPASLEVREEVAGLDYEIDVLSQFKANMAQLEDLQMRLKFVLGEVSGLLKKR
jgi:hypothetical protein